LFIVVAEEPQQPGAQGAARRFCGRVWADFRPDANTSPLVALRHRRLRIAPPPERGKAASARAGIGILTLFDTATI
jgi:hypothetical protein